MTILTRLKKHIIPGGIRPTPILLGPFRGARIWLNPQDNLRKIFGFYEHELNGWLERVLPQVDTVLDVGANDGYFTFGCAAAFQRLHQPADILSFEPQAQHIEQLQASLEFHASAEIRITIEQTLVGQSDEPGVTTLDAVGLRLLDCRGAEVPRCALVKIDVEGAELDVIAGASTWLRPENFFLIEVHDESYLKTLRERFAAAGLTLQQREQKPLPLLGREHRVATNWWLVSPPK